MSEIIARFPVLESFKDQSCRVCGRPLGQNPYWNFIGLCSWSCYLHERREGG